MRSCCMGYLCGLLLSSLHMCFDFPDRFDWFVWSSSDSVLSYVVKETVDENKKKRVEFAVFDMFVCRQSRWRDPSETSNTRSVRDWSVSIRSFSFLSLFFSLFFLLLEPAIYTRVWPILSQTTTSIILKLGNVRCWMKREKMGQPPPIGTVSVRKRPADVRMTWAIR